LEDSEIQEQLPLLMASAADILILRMSCDAVASNRGVREVEVAVVASDSGGLWGAFARVALPVLFTAIERVVVTFATDQVIDILSLLGSDENVATRKRLPTPYGEGLPRKNGERLEQDLLTALARAGLKVEPILVQRIVAMKKLRNECVHVHPGSVDDREFIKKAGFSGTARELALPDLRKAVEAVDGVLRLFSKLWLDEPWSTARVNAMSDLPIYVGDLAERLRIHDQSRSG
jgi:hypothetical protein